MTTVPEAVCKEGTGLIEVLSVCCQSQAECAQPCAACCDSPEFFLLYFSPFFRGGGQLILSQQCGFLCILWDLHPTPGLDIDLVVATGELPG